jgi:hypothetical protein
MGTTIKNNTFLDCFTYGTTGIPHPIASIRSSMSLQAPQRMRIASRFFRWNTSKPSCGAGLKLRTSQYLQVPSVVPFSTTFSWIYENGHLQ